MCGRFHTDEKMAEDLKKIVHGLDWKNGPFQSGDICPADTALVLTGKKEELSAERMIWGFPQYQKKGLFINARAESVLEKKSFQDSVLHRRCVIPGRLFYEWDREKNRVSFQRKNGRLLYMAGFYNLFEGKDHFVILTTEANDSVRDVHDRMPLLLEENEVKSWIYEDAFLSFALHRPQPLLLKDREYEQASLFDLL